MYERISSFFRRPDEVGAWGDGLVDLSLATLWYPTNWADVGDDEIVFLIPSLASRAIPSTDALPIALLRSALSTHVGRAAGALVAAGAAADEAAAARIVDRALATADIDATDDSWPSPGRAVVEGGQHRRPWLPALMIAFVLRRVLRRLEGTAAAAQRPLSLADALVLSVHTKFNGAYGQPEFAFAHELLTAGAWIGHVLSGRRALMPMAVAGCFLDVLTRDNADGASVEQALLTHYAEAAGGVDRLLAVSRRVVKGGRPLLMRGAKSHYDISRHPVWDLALAQHVLRRFNQAFTRENKLDA